ncbi:mannose-6-phosphate isomerase, class I [Vibrio metschnikovii]|uniref:mannose-6-phosphate isomerase, class I n=1 Tax=Vibrio metschnikovii TaxID=28172 RepID=UPI001C30DD2A|nr:mannose-6-phosphate isomerase, class I [Vibrio metschnikovii]
MKYLLKLENCIQNYPWGCKKSIQQWFGIDNVNQAPQAEIWMGTHPNGCSKVQFNGQIWPLSQLIETDKISFLSQSIAQQFSELPYLFKVLAAGNALSIQVHPSKAEAELGFAKEEMQGIDRAAANRNYRDANHKPELVYALTSYQAMNGFRPFKEIVYLFTLVSEVMVCPKISQLLEQFKLEMTSHSLERFFVGLLSLTGQDKQQALDALLTCAHQQRQFDNNNAFDLVLDLAVTYPSDIGLFSPLLLNVLTLQPGEAMYLDARTPHAYVRGLGLEVMANSDNVLRAGLTSKHIDVAELARCTLFAEKPRETLLLQPVTEGNKQSYLVPVADFAFDCFLKADAEQMHIESAEIIFSIDADTTLTHATGEILRLKKGESAFIPAFAQEYTITSLGRVARVFNCPMHAQIKKLA